MKHLKYLAGFLLSFALVGGIWAYSDVPHTLSSKYAIDYFTETGVIQGYEDGSFGPYKSINRAEAMKIITLVFPEEPEAADEANNEENIVDKFNDIKAEAWYTPFVQEGVNRGIVQGYQDGSFKPANQVNFSESLKMGLVAAGLDIEEVEYQDFHYEIEEADWFAQYFYYGYEKNLFDLNPDGDIEPIKPMNRGDFVELMYRIKFLDIEDPEATFDISYNWQDTVDETGLNVKYPLNWESQKIEDGLLLGYFGDSQVNFLNPGQDSVSIGIFHWPNRNKDTVGAYFENLKLKYKEDYPDTEMVIEEIYGDLGPGIRFSVDDLGIIDNYVFVSEDQILAGQAKYDIDSVLAEQFKKQIIKTFEKVDFLSLATYLSSEEKLELAREYLLTEGEGQNILDLFSDSSLIETDVLGVGTGPVDYYYIPEIDYTLKYERNSDILLDLESGETFAF